MVETYLGLQPFGRFCLARPSWNTYIPSQTSRLLFLYNGQGISQEFEVKEGEHFAVSGFAINAKAGGSNNARIKFYDLATGLEVKLYVL